MKGLLIVAFFAVYSVQAWVENFGHLHLDTSTGTVPQKYYPLTADDKHTTRKVRAFLSFIKILPKFNPFKWHALGPYHVSLSDINFEGSVILGNVVVHGIKGLSLSDLEMRLNPSRLDFNVSLPQVIAYADFELRAMLMNQPLSVYGQFSALVNNVAVSAAVGAKVAGLEPDPVYMVDSADVEIDLDELQLSIDLNQHAEDLRNILVQFLNNTDQYANIGDDLLRAVLKAVNKELTLITAQEIMLYLLGTARPSLSG